MRRWRVLGRGFLLVLLVLLAACSRPGGLNTTNTTNATGSPTAAEASLSATPGQRTAPGAPAPSVAPTPLPLSVTRPNEAGMIPIVMYHTFQPVSTSVWNRTPDEFRGDLEYFYAQGWYLTTMHQFVTGDITIPAGKSPIILTFDDGDDTLLRFITKPDGTRALDPNSAVGILEDMNFRYPDFGRGGVFSLNPFRNVSSSAEPLQFLLSHGYELGNHTRDHANLGQMTDEEIMLQIAEGEDLVLKYVPGATMETIALPFGIYPPRGDTTLLEGFSYQGRTYGYKVALMVGAEPAPSPFDKRRDLMWTPRINSENEQLTEWFGNFFQKNPQLRYVSDGNPATVTVPNQLPASLATNFDPASVGQRQLIRYDPQTGQPVSGPGGVGDGRQQASVALQAVLPTPRRAAAARRSPVAG